MIALSKAWGPVFLVLGQASAPLRSFVEQRLYIVTIFSPFGNRLFNYELERRKPQISLADRGQFGQFPEVVTEDLKGVHPLRRREAGDKVAVHLQDDCPAIAHLTQPT